MEPVQVGRYLLTSRLATGGMAEVYLARALLEDGSLGPTVAVKRLLPHLIKDAPIVRMFVNEAKITAQVSHPNVVKIVELGHGEDYAPFIAMELLDGHSFADLREKAMLIPQRVPLGITLRVLTEACRGLSAAHNGVDENGRPLRIVHRDFTPENIHVGFNGEVKVIDFGIARSETATASTEPGTLKGKFFYMSPEMIAGKPVDHRADIFAAGVMLYEQLCGRRPFTGQTSDQVLDRIATGALRRPSELDPSVPADLEQICLMALAREPDDRFESLDVFIRSIEALGGASTIAPGELVAQYVAQTFPLELDEKRRVLLEAIAQEFPAPALEAPTASAPAPAPSPPAARKKLRLPKINIRPAWLAIGLVPIVAAAGLWFWPQRSPSARLADAEATTDRGVRIARLAPLASSEDATAKQLARAGELLLQVHAADETLRLSESYARRFPEDVGAPLLDARASIELRRGKRAEAAVDRAEALAPSSPEPQLLLAALREAQDDVPGAQAALGAAEKKRPHDPELLGRKGMMLSRMGVLPDAADALQEAVSKRFEPAWAAELGYVRVRQGQLADAAQLLRRTLKKDPNLYQAHYYLGALLVKQRDVKGAEAAYLEAARLNRSDPRPLLSLCSLLIESGQTKDAQQVQRRLQEEYSKEASLGCRPPGGN